MSDRFWVGVFNATWISGLLWIGIFLAISYCM